MTFWRVVDGGVRVAVTVQPKSRRPGLGGRVPGIDGERLRIGHVSGDTALLAARLEAL